MEYSLIMPTLGDKAKVKRFLDSVERTTRYKHRIEVLFAIDEGNTEIKKFVERECYSFIIRWFERPQTDNFSDDYYNWLANRSEGRNIWTCNDDMWIRTHHWDKKITKKIIDSGWSIYLVDTRETTRGKVNEGFCCFPIVSRKAVEHIGFIFYPQVRIYPADKTIYGLFQKIERVIDAQDIVINSTYAPEDKNSRLWKIFQEDIKSGALRVDISKEVIKLLLAGSKDKGSKKQGKIDRIINILKEN